MAKKYELGKDNAKKNANTASVINFQHNGGSYNETQIRISLEPFG